MESRGGSGNRAGVRRVNGLIIGAVGGRDFALDIMRQRQRAHHRQQLLHRPAAFQFDDRPPRPLKANHAQRRTVSSSSREPGATGRCARINASHAPAGSSAGRMNSNSTLPPLSLRTSSRAGKTRVSLSTRTSPGFR